VKVIAERLLPVHGLVKTNKPVTIPVFCLNNDGVWHHARAFAKTRETGETSRTANEVAFFEGDQEVSRRIRRLQNIRWSRRYTAEICLFDGAKWPSTAML